MKKIIPFNTDKEGNSRTITTMYAKLGVNNCTPDFDKSGGGYLPAQYQCRRNGVCNYDKITEQCHLGQPLMRWRPLSVNISFRDMHKQSTPPTQLGSVGVSINPINRKMEFNQQGYKHIHSDWCCSLTAHDALNSPPCAWFKICNENITSSATHATEKGK